MPWRLVDTAALAAVIEERAAALAAVAIDQGRKTRRLIMATQAQIEELAARNAASFAGIKSYLDGLKAQLDAANAAANIDLTPLSNSVGEFSAYVDGLNPQTPAAPVEPPTEVPPVTDESGQTVSDPVPVDVPPADTTAPADGGTDTGAQAGGTEDTATGEPPATA